MIDANIYAENFRLPYFGTVETTANLKPTCDVATTINCGVRSCLMTFPSKL